jgi:DNA topoisomerase-6 subunit B
MAKKKKAKKKTGKKPKRKTKPKKGGKKKTSPKRGGKKKSVKPKRKKGPWQKRLDLVTPARAPSLPPAPDHAIPEPRKGEGKSASRSFRKRNAIDLAKTQREISVSEFFMKNRHLLGFDNPKKALLTTVKEAVDNALDACEEAGILPNVLVEIKQEAEDRFLIAVEDNGPGIVRRQIPRIFGKLLYGSKFHRLKQSRGQQGIGISAAGMYGQLTTGKPTEVISKPSQRRSAHYYRIQIDAKRNEPKILFEEDRAWKDGWTGTRVAIQLEAHYAKGRHSVENYLSQTVLSNPHATIRFIPPTGKEVEFPRTIEILPAEPKEIRPHPRGVELGLLIRMLQSTKARNVASFLKSEFSRVSPKVAAQLLETASIPPRSSPKRIASQMVEKLYRAINADTVRIMNPPTNCLSPIGQDQILESLQSRLEADYYTAVSRSPAVYRGNPFLVEAGIAFGVQKMDPDGLVKVYRYANKVPLLYQPGSCAITQAVLETDWRNYKARNPQPPTRKSSRRSNSPSRSAGGA